MAAIPETLAEAIEAEIAKFPAAAIRNAAQALSHAYRSAAARTTLSPVERAAYLAVRFPSTFAVNQRVLCELTAVIPTEAARSLLDVGAGPGTASLAAHMRFGDALKTTQIERDEGWRNVARDLANASGMDAEFFRGALAHTGSANPHDIVVASYVLGEIDAGERNKVVAGLWRATRAALVIIEPGTPNGFDSVREARAHMLAEGAHAAAPCTHDGLCPMTTDDWCHAPVRVQRSAAHRAAKDASLGYEDEKFSYVILTREPPQRRSPGRIVRRPIRNKGHLHLDLCEATGLRRETVARSNDAYRAARDAEWGDLWPTSVER